MDKSRQENIDAVMEKLMKKLPDSFVSSVRAGDERTLKDLVVNLSKEIEDVREQQKEDSTLNALKEKMKDLNGGYQDVKKEKTNRLKFILMSLESKGKL
jgi:polynucleotide 5'-kinase involved in rRNA processing